jgi:hypothetical protein
MPETVFVLIEEVDIIGVFTSREAALKCALDCNLYNYDIQEFNLLT